MKRRQGGTWPGILSKERFVVRVADAFWMVAGNMFVINMMRERPGPRCPSPHGRVYVFRRDLGGLSAAHRHGRGRQRVGIADQRMHGREKSDALIVVMKPANKAWEAMWRSGWSEGAHPRGNRKPWHAPDTGPGSCVIGGPDTESVRVGGGPVTAESSGLLSNVMRGSATRGRSRMR